MYNGALWLPACLQAVLEQDFQGTMELCIFDDASKVLACTRQQAANRLLSEGTLVSMND